MKSPKEIRLIYQRKWGVHESGQFIATVPEDEINAHNLYLEGCACKPKIELEGDRILILHNPFKNQ